MENNSSLEKLSAVAGELAFNGLEQQILRDYIARLAKLEAEVSAIRQAALFHCASDNDLDNDILKSWPTDAELCRQEHFERHDEPLNNWEPLIGGDR